MSIESRVTKIITDFMLSPSAGEEKLTQDTEGWIYDRDSNWGFNPRLLAQKILAEIGSKKP